MLGFAIAFLTVICLPDLSLLVLSANCQVMLYLIYQFHLMIRFWVRQPRVFIPFVLIEFVVGSIASTRSDPVSTFAVFFPIPLHLSRIDTV